MGIVICVLMALAILLLNPMRLPANSFGRIRHLRYIATAAIFIGGAWNTFAYGLFQLREFWGLAAVGSGVLMMVAAMIVTTNQLLPTTNKPLVNMDRLRGLVSAGLCAFFLLYFVTIVRLNLGLPIFQ